jgi:hypothetical protein
MRVVAVTVLVASAALALATTGTADVLKKSKPKMSQCGSFKGSSGSLAAEAVQSVAVSKGTSCSTGQSVAGGYNGKGGYKASGWKCSVTYLATPPSTTRVVCTKGSGRITYTLVPFTDCSSTPGVDQQVGDPFGPFVLNIDCPSAVPVFNQANRPGPAPAGWTCSGGGDSHKPSTFSCTRQMGSTWQIVQGGDLQE